MDKELSEWRDELYEQLSDKLIERCLSEKDWIERLTSQIVLVEKKITSEACLKRGFETMKYTIRVSCSTFQIERIRQYIEKNLEITECEVLIR